MDSSPRFKRFLAQVLRPLAHSNRELHARWQRLWSYARLREQLADLDPSVVVLGMPEIHGTGRIHAGRNLYLYRDLHLETQEGGEIHLGDDVVLSRGVHLVSFARIDIGRGSMIGEYSSVRDANHGHGDALPPRQAPHVSRPIHIGRNVWIGRGVTVVAGVTIGDHAVVGANAVVTQDVPPGAVVAGVPARRIDCRSSA